MTSISNIKIGRKIAFILGGIILLLTGLSALSLWGTSTNQKAATTLVQRMTKARLAATVEAETSAVTAAIERMVIKKKASDELVSEVRAVLPLLRRPRLYVVRTFRRWRPANRANRETFRRPRPGPFGYRACYALSVLLMLLLVGVLTPMALFRASLSVERRLQVKQAQLHLASALELHQASIDDQHRNGDRNDFAYREFFRDTAEWRNMGLLPLFAPDGIPSIRDHSDRLGTEIYSGWFRRLIYSLHHDYNDAAMEMLGVIPDRAGSDPSPDWT